MVRIPNPETNSFRGSSIPVKAGISPTLLSGSGEDQDVLLGASARLPDTNTSRTSNHMINLVTKVPSFHMP